MLLDHSTVRLGTAQPAPTTTAAAPGTGRRARMRPGAAAWVRRYSLVLTVFEVLAAAAALVEAFPLADEIDAAPRFEA